MRTLDMTGKKIELYTLKAVAKAEGVGYDYLRKLMMEVKAGKLKEWKGWRFITTDRGRASMWFGTKGNYEIVIRDVNPDDEGLD